MSDMMKAIAHYSITEKIGEGGMGVVYRAGDTKLGRDVALKVLPDTLVADAERVARFRREAQVLAQLNHPHIGGIYGFEEQDGTYALVLELIDGVTLEEQMKAGPIAVNDALRIALEIADAVEFAHEQGIIHRDLKPANVKLTSTGQVKVLDFGLAKALENPTAPSQSVLLSQSPTITGQMTGANVILGTAAYMSPEQARGQAVDRRADVWAFGVILFEMLTGTLLFAGDTVSDTLAGVLKTEFDWEALPADTPRRIRRLLKRCLNRDSKRRLRDIGDARLEIEEVMAGEDDAAPVEAAPVRRQAAWVLPAVIVAAAAAAALGAWFLKPQPSMERPLRKLAIHLETGDPSAASFFDPALSPDGRFVAYVSQDRLWVRDLESLEPREIPGTEGAQSPFWSPDARWIAFGVGTNLWKAPRDGGQPIVVAALPAQLASAASGEWEADDTIVFTTGQDHLYRVSAQGGDPVPLHEPMTGETDFHEMCSLPGGKGWVFVVHRTDGGYNTLGLLTPEGRRPDLITLEDQSLHSPCYSPSGHLLFGRSPTTAGVWALPFDLRSLRVTGDPFLVAAGGHVPHVSGDGTLVFSRGVDDIRRELIWLGRNGAVQGTIGEPDDLFPFPSLSPEDERVVVRVRDAAMRDIWLFDTVRDTRTRITFSKDDEDIASWHPDGRRILFHKVSGAFSSFISNADGTGQPIPIGGGVMPFAAPDGRTVVISKQEEGGGFAFDIFALDLENPDAEATPLIVAPGLQWWGVPSPSGDLMTYVSDESGTNEVYITTFPEPKGKWQVSTGGGDFPRWRGDGRELFYATHDGIVAADVDPGEGRPVLGRTHRLFERELVGSGLQWADAFDVTSDGQRFVIVRNAPKNENEETTSPSIAVVQNWAAEFAK